MQREREQMKVSECIIQGAEEDGGRLQKKDEIITSSDAPPKFLKRSGVFAESDAG